MKIFCIYTRQLEDSVNVANRCKESGEKFGYDVELFPSIYWNELNKVHKRLGLKQKYKPIKQTAKTNKFMCPAPRMANGTTHYILYNWCANHNESICILEHDAMFVGELPEPKFNGIIQISSHYKYQSNKIMWYARFEKMFKEGPAFDFIWNNDTGVVLHPLIGLHGTSGYIIHPNAARKLVSFIKKDGIAYADRIRASQIDGRHNLYLQKPQSIVCDHKVKSTSLVKDL